MVARLGLPAAMLPRALQQPQQVVQSVLRLHLAGANPHPQIVGLDRLPGVSNYFIGRDPRRWRTNVPAYARVAYRNIYPGVDLVYYGNQGHLEYDLVVAPGATIGNIRLAVAGARHVQMDRAGNVVLRFAAGDLHQIKPAIYQQVDGTKQEVRGRYVVFADHTIGFQIDSYDRHKPLVIDPTLVYSTYLGGSADNGSGAYISIADNSTGIAVDGSGAAYVTGDTISSDFPTTPGAFSTTLPLTITMDRVAFVTKLAPSGGALVYSTYLGGGNARSGGIAVDGFGAAYVTGYTYSSDFPTTPGAFSTTLPMTNHRVPVAFVTKLAPSGAALVYSTYLGGSVFNVGTGIAVDGSGAAYVTGRTSSSDFPTTPGAFSTTYHYQNHDEEAFVTKLAPSGATLVYSTYLGGSGYSSNTYYGYAANGFDYGIGIAVDGSGAAYVTGSTSSGDFPTTPGAFSTTYHYQSQYGEAFVTKLAPSGSALVYSTYLGGSGYQDYGAGIAVDRAGAAYVTGGTFSSDFPTTLGAFSTTYHYQAPQPGQPGQSEVFVTKLVPSGTTLVYSTYLGGNGGSNGGEGGTGVAVDGSGAAYVTGETSSTDFPTTPGAFSTTRGGGSSVDVANVFIAKLYIPSDAPAPTVTPMPTVTPTPTGTFAPTETPAPTDTPTPSRIVPSPGGGLPQEYNGGSNPSGKQTTCNTPRPVNCATGDFWHTFTDLSIPGRGIPLHVDRTYNSLAAAEDGPLGYGWINNYAMHLATDASGVISVTQENGSVIAFTPNGAAYQAPSRILATLNHNNDGSLVFVRANQERFDFSAPTTTTIGHLLMETDRNGYTTTLSYTNGQLSAVSDPEGRSLIFSYDGAHISRIVDPIGRTVSFTYDTMGELTDAQDMEGGVTHFTYDPNGTHLITSIRDPRGGAVSNVYDSAARVVMQTDAMDRTTAFTYTLDATGAQTTTITDARGNITVERYNNNVLLSITKGYGTRQAATWTYTYDPVTLGIASETDPNGHILYNTYDANGNLLTHIDALGRTTSYAYDALNDTTAITDPMGNVTHMTYDTHGNLLSTARPLGPSSNEAGIQPHVLQVRSHLVPHVALPLPTRTPSTPAHALNGVALRSSPSSRCAKAYAPCTRKGTPEHVPSLGNAVGTVHVHVKGTSVDDGVGGRGVDQFFYSGAWRHCKPCTEGKAVGMYAQSNSYDKRPGDLYSITFDGKHIALYSVHGPNRGVEAITLDGRTQGTVDLYSWHERGDVLDYHSPILAAGRHKLTVRVTRHKNRASTNYYIAPDRVIVDEAPKHMPPPPPSRPTRTPLPMVKPTRTIAPQASSTATAIGTVPPSATASSTPISLAPTATPSDTPRVTNTSAPSLPTQTPTNTATPTGTPTNTATPTGMPTGTTAPTGAPTASATSIPPTVGGDPTATPPVTSPSQTAAPSGTESATPVPSSTSTSTSMATVPSSTATRVAATTSPTMTAIATETMISTATSSAPTMPVATATTTGTAVVMSSPSATGTVSPVATPPVTTSCPRPDSHVAMTCVSYDPAQPGDVVARTDPNGHTTRYAYDANGDLASVSDPLGNTTTYTYDPIGRRTSVVRPLGNVAAANPISYTTTITYNAFGETTALTDAQGNTTTYQYDPDQNLITTTDALGRQAIDGYDLDNERTSVTRPDGITLYTSYDVAGNVISRTDGHAHRLRPVGSSHLHDIAARAHDRLYLRPRGQRRDHDGPSSSNHSLHLRCGQ